MYERGVFSHRPAYDPTQKQLERQTNKEAFFR